MNALRLGCWALLTVLASGCQSPRRAILAYDGPALLWPRPPDQPRIRYVGELRGESSLGIRPRGWTALRAVLAGPAQPIDFARPSAVAVRDQLVFVADVGLAVVHMLDLAQRRYAVLTGAPDDPLAVPIDLALAGDTLWSSTASAPRSTCST